MKNRFQTGSYEEELYASDLFGSWALNQGGWFNVRTIFDATINASVRIWLTPNENLKRVYEIDGVLYVEDY